MIKKENKNSDSMENYSASEERLDDFFFLSNFFVLRFDSLFEGLHLLAPDLLFVSKFNLRVCLHDF